MNVIDASVLVSALQPQDVHRSLSRQWLRQYLISGEVLIAPVLLRVEVAGDGRIRLSDVPAIW